MTKLPAIPFTDEYNKAIEILLEGECSVKDRLDRVIELKQYDLANDFLKGDRKINKDFRYPNCLALGYLKDNFITVDTDTKNTLIKTAIAADYDYATLITGASGTGKELLARSLHGSRSGKFLSINCTNLSDDLLESILFGHKQGSFTGAISNNIGFFEQSKDGTLFLDEIGDMGMSMQTKLLRVLQSGEYYRVGENIPQKSTARVVCATNKLPEKYIRIDLLARINQLSLNISPLSHRADDCKVICEHIIRENPYSESNAFMDFLNSPTKDVGLIEEFRRNLNLFNVRYLQALITRHRVWGELPN